MWAGVEEGESLIPKSRKLFFWGVINYPTQPRSWWRQSDTGQVRWKNQWRMEKPEHRRCHQNLGLFMAKTYPTRLVMIVKDLKPGAEILKTYLVLRIAKISRNWLLWALPNSSNKRNIIVKLFSSIFYFRLIFILYKSHFKQNQNFF